MPSHDIENSSFTELKAGKDSFVASATKWPVDELAARYVQARTDAKGRDEKLAEQADTLGHLNEALAAAKEDRNITKAEADKSITRLQSEGVALLKTGDALQASLDETKAWCEKQREEYEKATDVTRTRHADAMVAKDVLLRERSERADRLKAEADRNYAALSEASKLLSGAMHKHVIETADLG